MTNLLDIGRFRYGIDMLEMPSIPESVGLLERIIDLLILASIIEGHMGHAGKYKILLDDADRFVGFDVTGVVPANMHASAYAVVSWMGKRLQNIVDARFQKDGHPLRRRMDLVEFININFLVLVVM
jgi:hypothetical protein